MKKIFFLLLIILIFSSMKSFSYLEIVDGNIDHYQSTGCTPFLEPFDCKVYVEMQGPPPPGGTCLNGDKIIIDLNTEIQLDDDLYQAQPVSSTNGITCTNTTITKIIYSKTGRILTDEDEEKAQ